MSPSSDRFAVLAVALYLPLVAAVAIARAWRLTWSVRAALLVVVFGALMVLSERGTIDVALPRSSMLAVPIALGLALGAASIAGGFDADVLGRGFGWRQPLGLLANVAIVIGLVPAVLAIGDGAWHTPRTPMPRLLAAQLPQDPLAGDYRVLYVGDPRLMPVPSREFIEGVAYAVTDAGSFDFTDRFVVGRTRADDEVENALRLVADGSTLRTGRVLAPLGIRYVIIPKTDGVASKVDDPLPLADGLLAAFQNQLDIGSIYGPPSLEIFVNEAWFPVGAQLTGAAAEASRLAGEQSLVRSDLSSAVPSMVGADGPEPDAANEVAPGVVHIAIPFDDRLHLAVDGTDAAARTGFGVTTAFDIGEAGTGVLSYEQDRTRGWWLASQMALWFVLLVLAAGARSPFGRRRVASLHDETLIDLDEVVTDVGRGAGRGIVGEALVSPAEGDEFDDPEAWVDSAISEDLPRRLIDPDLGESDASSAPPTNSDETLDGIPDEPVGEPFDGEPRWESEP